MNDKKTDYIQTNKEAWEEAFAHRHANWGEDNAKRLREERLPFLDPAFVRQVEHMDLKGKRIAQFACNNGRELLSLLQLGAAYGIGFDIAENIITQAVSTAERAGIQNASFVCCDILDIPKEYHATFDLIFFTIGAITWFRDLDTLFRKVSDCLREGGILLIHDFHPFMNMLAMPGEGVFEEKNPAPAYSYFRKEPWIENEGMEYMSVRYPSKTFTSFSHTMSDIVNATIRSGMRITKLDEYDYDVGLTDAYDSKEYPLSYLLAACKV